MLTFHRAAPGEEWDRLPNREFYINLDYLNALLTYLKGSGWEIVSIDQMIERLARSGKRRLVNFSIDDGYVDTFEHVIPLFRSFGVPVTLFITTGIPDETDLLGWAGLETIISERETLLTSMGKVDVSDLPAKRRWFTRIAASWGEQNFDQAYQDFCRINGADVPELRKRHAITWRMLESLKDDPLVEIGAHTISHARISSLPIPAALHELRDSAARLRQRLGVPCRHFAFPYGRMRDCGVRDFLLTREAGFVSAATTIRGLVKPGQDLFQLPRNNMNGAYQSLIYAKASLTGLSGVVAKVLRRG